MSLKVAGKPLSNRDLDAIRLTIESIGACAG